MGDPCINPPGRIRDIGTIHGNFVTDEKVLRDILLDPFAELSLILRGPPALPHLPDLMRGLVQRLAERRGRDEDNNRESQKETHNLYLKKDNGRLSTASK